MSAPGRPKGEYRSAQHEGTPASRRSRGFGAVAAIVVLVVLAALAAALVRLGAASHAGSSAALAGARASQAARAGVEWGLYQALKGGWAACAGASQTLDLSAAGGLHVTVTCSSSVYNEGLDSGGAVRTVRVYTIDAVACNAVTCPDNGAATGAHYVERRRQLQAE